MQSNPQPLDRGTRCPAVDVAVIDEFRSWFGPERTDQFATLVLSYQTEAEAMIVQLASDAGNEDRPSMARTLHKLQGSSATIGAGSVAHLCATVDVFTSPDLSAMVSELAAEQGRFVAEIQVVLADRPAG